MWHNPPLEFLGNLWKHVLSLFPTQDQLSLRKWYILLLANYGISLQQISSVNIIKDIPHFKCCWFNRAYPFLILYTYTSNTIYLNLIMIDLCFREYNTLSWCMQEKERPITTSCLSRRIRASIWPRWVFGSHYIIISMMVFIENKDIISDVLN